MVWKTKDAGLRLRVEREIRHEFVEACRGEGKTAAQVLREYMRDYIARHRAVVQRELFAEKPSANWQSPRGSSADRSDAPQGSSTRRRDESRT